MIACVGCNSVKANRTPEQARMRLFAEPIKPKHLPETLHLTFTKENVPGQWKAYLRAVVYMHGELETD